MPKSSREKRGASIGGPGLIYSLIMRRVGTEEKKEKKKKDPVLEFYKKARPGKKRPPKEVEKALEFLGWDVDPAQIPTAARSFALQLAVLGLVLTGIMLYFVYFDAIMDIIEYPEDIVYYITDPMFVFTFLVPLIFYFAGYYFLLYYPVSAMQELFRNELPRLPRVIGYIAMSMKLVPNLEKAVTFASQHAEGRIAEELRSIIWNTQIGVYAAIEEALDKLAYKWGIMSEEFKHALMRIRASVMEGDEAKRYILLDNAVKEIVNGVKEKMLNYASKLYMPSMQLFYVGVFLPLLLLIIIPVGAAFTSAPLARPEVLVILYNLALPAAVFFMAKNILAKRPAVYSVPDVPDRLIEDYKRIKNRALFAAFAVLIFSLGVGYILHMLLDWTPEKVALDYCGYEGCLESLPKDFREQLLKEYDVTPYWLIYSALLGIVGAICTYLFLVYSPKKRIQDETRAMEGEFKDAIYILASRMGEGKPLESALEAVVDTMPESKIAKLFRKLSYNVNTLGLTLEEAVFSPVFGALKDVPSRLLRDAMKVVVDAVNLGTELASKALLTLSEQLRNEEIVARAIKEKMSEIAAMMMAMAFLVAPIVLGITVALQQVIMKSISGFSVETELPPEVESQLGFSLPKAQQVELPSPTVFLIIVGVYVIEVVALLIWFSSNIKEGEDRIGTMLTIAKFLPVALFLFIITSWFSLTLVRGMLA